MDPLVFMLALRSMTTAEYDLWGPSIPYTEQVTNKLDYDEFSETDLIPSFTIVVCALASLIFFQPSIILHSCRFVIFKWNTCVRWALLLVLLSTLPIYPGQSMLMTLTALLRSVLLAAIWMSQVTLFLKVHRRWVIFYSSFYFSCILQPLS